MRKRRKATIATLATLASVMVVTVASAGVTQTDFNPSFGGLSGLKGGGLTAGSQIIYDNNNNLGTQSNWDWTNASYAWADDVHFKDNDTVGWIITAMNYGYLNQGFGSFTVSHTIRIYDSVGNPSGTHPSSVGGSIVAVATINVGPLPGTGVTQSVVITGLSIQVGHAAWISFDESVPNGGRTFWLTGGIPSVGSSHDGLGYFNHGVYYGWAPSPLAFTGVIANQAMTITGTKVPGPSVIALLGLSGLATLSRRRRK
jgi:hypothetical protein